ncbi:TetR/AcrR family transcriptional regulator [Pseudolysinimonas kribbensis]|uniref:TetR family transcriptional regulator n=1 Tax=Pseudolysinimonas kribbensis TaxID=433641 RepID=A0ABQ6K016_9MICO|nr:TetR/AcrR family transcriptional regulator [Pseudolysinimonas kribbensis]GMA93942.1 TetR family transcriptional regulator [Pseudolysinimonas kribbensis]
MPRTAERGGPRTRERIARIASRLFLERGFDAVTVAEVAREAGVSSVTVFNHFPRKEDLFLDRAVDASDVLLGAVRDRDPGTDVLAALHAAADDLVARRHALSGLAPLAAPFFRTVAASPALISRARELGFDLERTLAKELERDPGFDGDATLLAALFIAGYRTVLVETARRVLAGDPEEELATDHGRRLARLFAALTAGVTTRE